MKFSEVPIHSWFFLPTDMKYPKYKSGVAAYMGTNIMWETEITPDIEVFSARYDEELREYFPVRPAA